MNARVPGSVGLRLIVLAFMLFTSCPAYAWSSRASRTYARIEGLAAAISAYHDRFAKFPAPDDYWIELRREGLLEANETERPLDQWGHPLVYRIPGKHGEFDLYSYGQDGIDNHGALDDISSWAGVNDGYYWKGARPKGRLTIVLGIILGGACLPFARICSWSLIAPSAGIFVCLGVMLGCHWLMHPGIVPSRNDPLNAIGILAFFVFVILAGFLSSNIRKPRITKN
jgi:hypothetical protein